MLKGILYLADFFPRNAMVNYVVLVTLREFYFSVFGSILNDGMLAEYSAAFLWQLYQFIMLISCLFFAHTDLVIIPNDFSL